MGSKTPYQPLKAAYYRDRTIKVKSIDFIFGDASVVFQNRKLIVRKLCPNQACMITRQKARSYFGLVVSLFKIVISRSSQTFTSTQPAIKAYLGRPWKEYSRTIIMQSNIDAFVDPKDGLHGTQSTLDSTLVGTPSIVIEVQCRLDKRVFTRRAKMRTLTKHGDDTSSSQVTTSTKSVESMCQPTPYKETREKTLSAAKNVTSQRITSRWHSLL
ncbi:hypothetical protein HAX54_048836 [Datura stramonium]|uniref:Pectinesterase catalytic domain-containing protein n=1 Tax=Datura stramonium TaxID=4076 RepID=A0ABS8WLW7_DATST|nr:hypothetical protein [Datura stramonium]